MKKVEKVEKRGRKVNPNSARQIRLKELEAKRANGELKRGRPVNPNSVRQLEMARKIFNKEVDMKHVVVMLIQIVLGKLE
jgi:hypothetical protein